MQRVKISTLNNQKFWSTVKISTLYPKIFSTARGFLELQSVEISKKYAPGLTPLSFKLKLIFESKVGTDAICINHRLFFISVVFNISICLNYCCKRNVSQKGIFDYGITDIKQANVLQCFVGVAISYKKFCQETTI